MFGKVICYTLIVFDIRHDVQEVVVQVGLVLRMDLDSIEVGERIGDVQRAVERCMCLGIHGRVCLGR